MPNALITGPGARASDVADALRGRGFDPVCADDAAHLVELCASGLPKSLDCYVQFPDEHPGGMTALAEMSAMVAAGGMSRYEAATTVAPLLTGTANVLLVMGARVEADGRSDLTDVMDGLTRVVAGALRQDYRATGVRVALVDDRRSPSEIASIAGRGRHRPPPISSYVDLAPGLGFADWRHEVLSLVEVEG